MSSVDAVLLTGPGGAHLDAYFRALAQVDLVGRVGVADASGAAEGQAREVLGDKLLAFEHDHRKLLAEMKPRFALVSTEALSAPPIICAALEAGCHVMAEKPSCIRAADFAEIVTLAEAKHKHLMLALANRLRPRVEHARKLIRSGAIGKIYGLEQHIIADQTRLRSPAYHKAWFADKARAGGGQLIWLGIHWLDLAMFLTGANVVEAAAFTGIVGGQPLKAEDSAAAILKFDQGFFGTITGGYYLDRGYHSHVKIWGSQGWLQLEPHGAVQLQWYSTAAGSTGGAAPQVQVYDGPPEASDYTPFVRAAAAAAADPNTPPPITGREGLRALQTVFACYESAETGRATRVG